MENCAFVDIFTTMNDLFGSHNCPIMFRCEMSTFEDVFAGLPAKSKTICMVPDEKILGNGTAFHGYSNVEIEVFSSNGNDWLLLKDGLMKVYGMLSWLSGKNVYIIGYGLKGYALKVLNENFERVLGKSQIEFDEKKLIDVESLARLLVDIGECGNYNKNSILASFKNIPPGLYGNEKKLKTEISKTRLILTELMTRGNIKTDGHMGSFKEVSDFLRSPQPVEYFQVGKYKGMKIDEAFEKDRQYFTWIMKNSRFFENDKNLLRKVEDLLNSEDK